jgi:hypothetical protein
MRAQGTSNRLIAERQQVKVSYLLLLTFIVQDHVMHIERLRQVKPTISIREPKKLGHMQVNYKKEMQNLGKCNLHVS